MTRNIFQKVKSWKELENRISRLPIEKQRGDAFEDFCEGFLVLTPEYNIKNIWRHGEIPSSIIKSLGFKGQKDLGIDFVAETKDGKLWGIQSKFRRNREDIVSYRELSTTLAISDKTDYRLIVTNTLQLPDVIQKRKNVGQILVDSFEKLPESFFKDLYKYQTKKIITYPKPFKPRPHQVLAIKKSKTYFKSNSTGQLIMACGTGKTLTSVWVAEALKAKSILIMVPSLSLLRQTLGVWSKNTKIKPFHYLCVCSDPTVDKESEYHEKPDKPLGHIWELDIPVTTDAKDIKTFLNKKIPKGLKVIFSTYQSGNVLLRAVGTKNPNKFDLVIYDEAHRTAGFGQKLFNLAIDPKNLPSKKRLFMTATKKIIAGHVKTRGLEEDIELFSMDDEKVYGKEIYYLGFSEAIKRKLLTDYKVAVIGVTDEEIKRLVEKKAHITFKEIKNRERNAMNLAKQISLVKAMKKYKAHHVISFHSRVNWAKSFIDEANPFSIYDVASSMGKLGYQIPPLVCRHVNGEMTSAIRNKLIKEFEEGKYSIISNARCLTEGVDIPKVDGIFFFDPKHRLIDIVQATGRALRLYPKKKCGYIVIPVIINREEDADDIISGTDFKQIWSVIKAMDNQDERLQEVISKLSIEKGKSIGGEGISSTRETLEQKLFEKVEFVDLPQFISAKNFYDRIKVKLVEHIGQSWDFIYGLLIAFKAKNQNRWPATRETFKGFRLWQWCAVQRQMRRVGKLSKERIEKLNKIQFVWSPHEKFWIDGLSHLLKFRENNPNKWPVAKEIYNNFKLGAWCDSLRQRYKANSLSYDQINKLNNLGFPWALKDELWEKRFKVLKSFRKQHPRMWPKGLEKFKGFDIGSWCHRQRKYKKMGWLTKEKIEALNDMRFPWIIERDTWRYHFDILKLFRKENPNRWPTQKEIFKKYRLGQWCGVQRQAKRKGMLSKERIQQLNAIDFSWDPKEDSWKKGFEYLLNYKKEYPDKWPSQSEKYRNYKIGSWCNWIRNSRKDGILSDYKIRRLDTIDFPWMPLGEHWKKRFNFLKEFRKKYPNRWPSAKEMFKGYRIGQWCDSFRQSKKRHSLSKDKIIKLNNIGFPWTPKHDSWEHRFKLLIQFRNKYPSRWPKAKEKFKGFTLNHWLDRQKKYKKDGLLSKDRINKFESIGFQWDQNKWETAYNLLNKFRKKFPNKWPLFKESYEGYKLGQWVIIQRRSKVLGTVTKEKMKKLSEIGFPWDIKEEYWEKGFSLLKSYKKNSPKDWPFIVSRYKGFNLTSWANVQRQLVKKGHLSKNKITKLNGIGFSWDPQKEHWEKGFLILKEYKKNNPQDWPMQKLIYKKFKLGLWCTNQRQSRKKHTLAKEKIIKLNTINFPWDFEKFKWDYQFKFLLDFKRKYSHKWPTGRIIYKGIKLGQWCEVLRRSKKRGTLSKDRIMKLDKIGFPWRLK